MVNHYRTLMQEAAEELNFEAAEQYRRRMSAIEKHYSKSVITSSVQGSCDVFSLIVDSGEAFGNYLRVVDGAIIQSLNLGFRMNIEESRETVLSTFIAEIRSSFGALSREVIVPFMPDVELDDVEFRIPVRGDKLALLELSAKNAGEMRFNALKQREHSDPDSYRMKVMEELRDALKENGIGRPSTRAAIIETLFKRDYIRKERKSLYPTPTGRELIATIREELLKSAELTGIWERKLRQIERGEYEAQAFIAELKSMVADVVFHVLNS